MTHFDTWLEAKGIAETDFGLDELLDYLLDAAADLDRRITVLEGGVA